MKLSASILATRLSSLDSLLPTLDPTLIDYIHMDIMDGNYVPQISFGEALTKEVKELTQIPLDVHLMVKNPEQEVPKYFPLQPAYITFHAETTNFGVRLAEEIRKNGCKAGVSLNPGTPLTAIEHLLPYIDLILLMTVDPGFYGQSFVRGGLDKIQKAREMILGSSIVLEMDGGLTESNVVDIIGSGAELCVAGSALFKGAHPNENARKLKGLTSHLQKKI
ncbi:MAG: ribulose-phosphate 3-epimerase [Leptospiraceae bacterium]|nr:ribulose-phosphate 3-epimerase [Leptospiraceae bacterium]